jgi:uncharacterized protein (TIGR03437 family)
MTRITKHRIPPPKKPTRPTLLATCLFGLAGLLSPLRAQQPPAITYAASLYYISGMASDPQGNVYVVGSSAEVLSTTPGVAYPTPPQGDINSYLIKLDPHGGLVFTTYLPGDAFGVAADQNGNAYVGAFNGGASGQRMGLLVATVDPTGAKVTLTQTYGGTCTGSPLSCGGPDSFAIDGQGDAYLAGNTSTTDFPTTPGAFQPKLNCSGASGCQNGFIIKLNPKTGQVIYATYLGGSGSQDYLLGLATDTAGNLYGVGDTHSSDFPVTPNAYRTTLGNGATSFITKLNPLGAVVYSTYFDALDLNGVAVDASGAAFVTGYAQMGTALTPDAAAGGAVVAKLSPDGRSLVFSALFDHDGDGMAIAVDTSGSPSVIGGTQGTLLPEITPLQGQRGNTNPRTTCDPGTSFQHSCWDAFLVKLDPQGKRLVWASTLGGKWDDWGKGIALDTAGNIYAWLEGFAGLPVSGMFTGGGGPSIIKVEPVGPPPLFAGTSVVSSAGFAAGIAGGGLVSIFGAGLSTADGIVSAPSFPLPTTLAGTSVWFGGRPASILAAAKVDGQEQVNVQFPVLNNAADFNSDFTNVIMRRGRALGFAFNVEVFSAYWPSIFLSADGQPVVTHADYSLVTASNPAHAGETIVIFATGLGAVTPPIATGAAAPLSPLTATVIPFTVAIGGQGAPVAFEGLAPGFAGLYQVNAVVPAVPVGQVKLTLGANSNVPVTVTIAVQ